MLQILKRIRQKLINQGKLKQYLLYGVGEILLIVIGILVAVQINSYNENVKASEKEQQLLLELLAELNVNEAKIKQQLVGLNKNTALNERYVQRLAQGVLTMSDIAEMHRGPNLTVGTSNPSFGAINALVTTGDIVLIKHDSLRNLLSNWKDELSNFVENEEYHLAHVLNEILPYLRKEFIFFGSKIDPVDFYDVSASEMEVNYLAATKSTEYRSLIIDNGNWQMGIAEVVENTLEKVRGLKALIEANIKKTN